MRDGTLSEVIAGPTGWNDLQRLATLIQIAHTLNYCRSLGLVAHQDLKPDNILIGRIPLNSLSNELGLAEIVGFTTVAYVSDFGMADAFRHIGKNSGSRPYMAPEQYEKRLLVDGSKIDVFALGVIAFELFADGLHPIGERTSEVWPEKAPGKPSKWNHEDVWKIWSGRSKCFAPLTNNAGLPRSVNKLVERSLAADAAQRPGMDEFENELWLSLVEVSRNWAAGVRMQIEYFDSFAPPGESRKPSYMDECIEKLREFYSQT
jgi:serine/threonine protein kinase